MAEAGVEDMAQGVALLTASDDIALSERGHRRAERDDLALGMELAAIGGQLR